VLVAFALALVPLALGPRANQVHVVDDQPGPGVDFTAIQAAIDAAADGDTILVRSGEYASFAIDGKALRLIGDAQGGAKPRVAFGPQVVAIANAPASRELVLRGLRIEPRIEIASCAGTVLLEDVESAGVQATACGALSIVRSELFGSLNLDTLRLVDSSAHAWQSVVHGGYPGRAGARLTNSALFLLSGHVAGGPGLIATQNPFSPFCSSGGAGGAGVALTEGSQCTSVDAGIQGGSGGPGSSTLGPPPMTCPSGPAGPSVSGAGYLPLAGHQERAFEIASPAFAGSALAWSAIGEPGDFVFALISAQPNPQWMPSVAGTLLVTLDASVHVLGLLPQGPHPASKQGSVPLAPFALGIESIGFAAQGAFFEPASSRIVLGSPSWVGLFASEFD